jgi:hypothetical protein
MTVPDQGKGDDLLRHMLVAPLLPAAALSIETVTEHLETPVTDH